MYTCPRLRKLCKGRQVLSASTSTSARSHLNLGCFLQTSYLLLIHLVVHPFSKLEIVSLTIEMTNFCNHLAWAHNREIHIHSHIKGEPSLF